MKTAFFATVIAAALAAPLVTATAAVAGSKGAVVVKPTIVVSCFRGPWHDVIWDRPNAKFIDSLVEAGYDFPTAHAIGERLCRDDAIVGKHEDMRTQMYKTMEQSPPR